MRHREVGDGNVFKQITSEIYDTNEAYAMLCILRNYLVHSNDVVHGVHIGFDGLKIWTDRDIVLRDIEWSKAKCDFMECIHFYFNKLHIVSEKLCGYHKDSFKG